LPSACPLPLVIFCLPSSACHLLLALCLPFPLVIFCLPSACPLLALFRLSSSAFSSLLALLCLP
jgi:hypothetical protein